MLRTCGRIARPSLHIWKATRWHQLRNSRWSSSISVPLEKAPTLALETRPQPQTGAGHNSQSDETRKGEARETEKKSEDGESVPSQVIRPKDDSAVKAATTRGVAVPANKRQSAAAGLEVSLVSSVSDRSGASRKGGHDGLRTAERPRDDLSEQIDVESKGKTRDNKKKPPPKGTSAHLKTAEIKSAESPSLDVNKPADLLTDGRESRELRANEAKGEKPDEVVSQSTTLEEKKVLVKDTSAEATADVIHSAVSSADGQEASKILVGEVVGKGGSPPDNSSQQRTGSSKKESRFIDLKQRQRKAKERSQEERETRMENERLSKEDESNRLPPNSQTPNGANTGAASAKNSDAKTSEKRKSKERSTSDSNSLNKKEKTPAKKEKILAEKEKRLAKKEMTAKKEIRPTKKGYESTKVSQPPVDDQKSSPERAVNASGQHDKAETSERQQAGDSSTPGQLPPKTRKKQPLKDGDSISPVARSRTVEPMVVRDGSKEGVPNEPRAEALRKIKATKPSHAIYKTTEESVSRASGGPRAKEPLRPKQSLASHPPWPAAKAKSPQATKDPRSLHDSRAGAPKRTNARDAKVSHANPKDNASSLRANEKPHFEGPLRSKQRPAARSPEAATEAPKPGPTPEQRQQQQQQLLKESHALIRDNLHPDATNVLDNFLKREPEGGMATQALQSILNGRDVVVIGKDAVHNSLRHAYGTLASHSLAMSLGSFTGGHRATRHVKSSRGISTVIICHGPKGLVATGAILRKMLGAKIAADNMVTIPWTVGGSGSRKFYHQSLTTRGRIVLMTTRDASNITRYEGLASMFILTQNIIFDGAEGLKPEESATFKNWVLSLAGGREIRTLISARERSDNISAMVEKVLSKDHLVLGSTAPAERESCQPLPYDPNSWPSNKAERDSKDKTRRENRREIRQDKLSFTREGSDAVQSKPKAARPGGDSVYQGKERKPSRWGDKLFPHSQGSRPDGARASEDRVRHTRQKDPLARGGKPDRPTRKPSEYDGRQASQYQKTKPRPGLG